MLQETKARMKALVVAGVLLCALPLLAHHGSSISYDMDHPWTAKVTVTQFHYQNPHPSLFFDRVNDKGETEHWTTEFITNPSFLIRAGWTKTRSDAALKPGTVVTVTVCTSRVGGTNGAVTKVLNDKGEEIVTARGGGNQLGQGGGGNGGGGNNLGNGSGNPAERQ